MFLDKRKTKSTKELARKLGLLGTNNETVCNPRPVCGIRQLFSYLVILDFESTCWQSGDNFKGTQEIIEFPAVLLNTSTGVIEDTFQQFVFPTEYPKLSVFCTNFTGITQATVDAGVPLHICLNLFGKWMQKVTTSKNIKTDDGRLAFVTWSDWDLGTCLANECKRKLIYKPEMFDEWIDLRATFKKFYSRNPVGLRGALKDVGLDFHGRQHCGLDDAKNTAFLAWKMICDGCVLTLTKCTNSKQK